MNFSKIKNMTKLHVAILLAFLFSCLTHICYAQYLTQTKRCSYFSSPELIELNDLQTSNIILPQTGENTYKPNQYCEWRIRAKKPNNVIRLEAKRLSIQGRDIYGECYADHIDVFDVLKGTESFMNRMCGIRSTEIFISSGPEMLVRFQSDQYHEYSGFHLACKAIVSEDRSEFSMIYLKVGIPIGVVFIPLIIAGLFFVYRTCKMKKTERERCQELRSTPSQSINRNRSDNSSATNRTDVNQVVTYNLTTSAVPRVAHSRGNTPPPIPSSSLPPPYESLGYSFYHSENVSPIDHVPLTPPPYEDVVKESVPQYSTERRA